MSNKFLLSPENLDDRDAIESVRSSGAGGIVAFVGRVRDHARGRAVECLEYEAYPEMVLKVFEAIAAEAKSKFEILDLAIHHRTGQLQVGEVSVVIAVSAEHRGAAFAACQYAIDNLKQRAPIWKKEYGPDGAVWVEERP